MYFRFNRRYNLLQIDDDFAHLQQIHRSGDMEFNFFYKVSPHDAIVHEALTVKISVFSRTITRPPLLENSHLGVIDTRKLVGNVLTLMPKAKSAVKQRAEFNVAVKESDVSAKINNEILGQLRARVPASNIQQLNKPVLKTVPASEVKQATEVKPVLTQIAHQFTTNVDLVHSASVQEKPTKLMFDMIFRQGSDPSAVTQLTHRSVPAVDNVGGILRPSRAMEFETSPVTRLLNFHLFPPKAQFVPKLTSQVQDSTVVQVLVHEPQTQVEVASTVTVPRHALTVDGQPNSHLFVKFELINGRSGIAIDTITKPLDVARHSQLYYTPRRPPTVKVTRSEISTRANLEIKQVDPGAEAIQLYKKNVYRAVTDIDDYTLVGTYNVRRNEQSLLVQVDLPRESVALYRAVPVGRQGTQGFEFTNTVVRPTHFRPMKALSLTALPVDIGIRLEVRQIPPRVTAIELLGRNRTTFESDWNNVGGDISLIDDSVREADFLTIVDRSVSPNNVYEYVARLVYEGGTEEYTGNALVEFIQPVPGKVDTKIDNVEVTQGTSPNVTFTITTTVIDTNLDVVKALLQRQDIYDQFKDDVTREREFLTKLIAHNVQRVDLTTGNRDDFGVVTTTSFDDSLLSKNQAIAPLKLGHRYRYEVMPLLRAPETMFETLIKQKVDAVTKKSYSFSPAKFLHPLALTRGIIVTSAGLRTRFSKEAMSHGAIGSIESMEVSFNGEQGRIVDPAAARFDKFLNVITWKLEGDISLVDHFLIMKEVHGVRTMIGKAHSEFAYGNCQYLHPVGRRDEGSFSYVIVPVFNNYKTGVEASTNAVIVEAFPDQARFETK